MSKILNEQSPNCLEERLILSINHSETGKIHEIKSKIINQDVERAPESKEKQLLTCDIEPGAKKGRKRQTSCCSAE